MKLLFHRIRPVFVFDGGAPALKGRTLAARRKLRSEGTDSSVRKTAQRILASQLKKHKVCIPCRALPYVCPVSPPRREVGRKQSGLCTVGWLWWAALAVRFSSRLLLSFGRDSCLRLGSVGECVAYLCIYFVCAFSALPSRRRPSVATAKQNALNAAKRASSQTASVAFNPVYQNSEGNIPPAAAAAAAAPTATSEEEAAEAGAGADAEAGVVEGGAEDDGDDDDDDDVDWEEQEVDRGDGGRALGAGPQMVMDSDGDEGESCCCSVVVVVVVFFALRR